MVREQKSIQDLEQFGWELWDYNKENYCLYVPEEMIDKIRSELEKMRSDVYFTGYARIPGKIGFVKGFMIRKISYNKRVSPEIGRLMGELYERGELKPRAKETPIEFKNPQVIDRFGFLDSMEALKEEGPRYFKGVKEIQGKKYLVIVGFTGCQFYKTEVQDYLNLKKGFKYEGEMEAQEPFYEGEPIKKEMGQLVMSLFSF